jgi:class 3 adenylate cyclase/tetratricopeptide (TPR) repeat protein
MLCPHCQHDNVEDARFCGSCGRPLPTSCPRCGRSNSQPGSKFCQGCGSPLTAQPTDAPIPEPRTYTPSHLARKILRDRSRLEGERRNVTVLFADASGFTALSERADPERVYDLMQGCLERMMGAVHTYEGTVTHFTGDGIMALFGAPIAHEDSARRGVLAALAMQSALQEYAADLRQRIPIDCRFRVGLNTGPVVVGKISDDLDMDYTAIGDTVNLASRMEQAAEPGSAYLTESTWRAVRDYIECEPVGPLAIKGKADPIAAYRAVGEKAVRTRFEVATERGLTPLAGRESELQMLEGFYRQARGGQGRIVFVSGDAGIGKSRLLLELSRRLEAERIDWLAGRCISYGKHIPYLPISDLLRHSFGVQENDPEGRIQERVDEATGDWSPAARNTVPYLKYLLNVDPGDVSVTAMDAMARRAGILDGLRAFLIETSHRRPLVVLIEDLHWIDTLSEEALAAMAEVVATVPVLLILTYRPGYTVRVGERSHFSRLALAPLPETESRAMAGSILQARRIPHHLEQLIVGKAEGNPFYIEEVARSLIETGILQKSNGGYRLVQAVEDVVVPDTIQEVILSRIDRLEKEAREAIQLASVIGREFTVRLLNRIASPEAGLDPLLGELKALELIYEKSYFPELAFMFKHALIHDVAYETLLEERRKALHRLIGTAIEELYSDRLAEHYETLAHHYWEGQAWRRALDYLLKAATKAAAVYANQDALRYFDRALEACRRLDAVPVETLMTIYSGKADVSLTINDWPGLVANYTALREQARAVGEERVEALALSGIGVGRIWTHQFDLAEVAAREALAIARRLGDDGVRGAAVFVLGNLDSLRGEVDRARERIREAIPLTQAAGLPLFELMGRIFNVLVHSWSGRYPEAHRLADEAVVVSREYRATFMLLFNLWAQGLALGSHGRYAEAIRVLREAIALCERMGDKSVQSRCWNTLGWIHCELGAWEEGVEFNRRGLELAETVGDNEIIINAQINLADLAFVRGQREAAGRDLTALYGSLPERHEWMKWRYSQHVMHSLGETMLRGGDASGAERLAGECLAMAERTQALKNVVKARRLLGESQLAQDRMEAAAAELERALAVALRIENPPQLWKTYASLGRLHRARGRPSEAREADGEARVVIERTAGALDNDALRARLLQLAPDAAARGE